MPFRSEINENTEEKTNSLTVLGIDLIKEGNFKDAYNVFSDLLKNSYNNSFAETGLRVCKYWQQRENIIKNLNTQNISIIYEEWKKFEINISSYKNVQPKVVNSAMVYIFNTTLQLLKKDIENNKIIDITATLLLGIAYKKLGDFNNALQYFEKIIKYDKNNAIAYAQLGDCYALIDEERKAKVLYREAFFIDPSSIDLYYLESNIIKKILEVMRDMDIPQKEFNYWLPVYGRVFNILNVKRDLLPYEYGRIKQDIYNMEQDFIHKNMFDEKIKARLINFYLWLYDYYLIKKSDLTLIYELEEKIKSISYNIYNLLKNN